MGSFGKKYLKMMEKDNEFLNDANDIVANMKRYMDSVSSNSTIDITPMKYDDPNDKTEQSIYYYKIEITVK